MGQSNIEKARKVIEQIAIRDGVSVEYVRTHMKSAMLNGLCSDDPKIKAFWKSIPCKDDIPTPEEFIVFTSAMIQKNKPHT